MEPQENKGLATQQKALALQLESDGMKRRMAGMLPKHLTPERMVRIALMAANKNPALYRCSPESFLKAMMDASEVGLEAGGTLQHAALVPYKGQVQFQPMVRGLIELAKRGGEVMDVEAGVAYEGDIFEYERGYVPKFRHVEWDYRSAVDRPTSRGKVIAAYAIFWLKGMERPKIEVVPQRDLEHIQGASKAKSPETPWNQWPDEMRKKTAIKRGCKTLRLSPELAKAIDTDNRLEGVLDTEAEIIDTPVSAPLTPGRHKVGKPKEKPKAEAKAEEPEPPSETPPEEESESTGFDRKAAIDEIKGFSEIDENWEAFVAACKGIGINPRAFEKSGDGQLEALLGKVCDLSAPTS